jgi:dUTP pyrophosphatase
MKLEFLKMYDDVIIPAFATEHSACFDLRAYLIHPDTNIRIYDQVVIPSMAIAIVGTGLKSVIPRRYSIRLHPRSGMSVKGISLANCEGVIDADYNDEIKVILINHSHDPIAIKHQERICQGELVENETYQISEISKDYYDVVKNVSDRKGGLGSTGSL